MAEKDHRIKELMEPGEEILERTGLHWMVYRWPAILLIYGACLTVLFLTSFINLAMVALPFALMFLAIVGFVLIAFRRMATEYVVTNKGLILIEGFIGSVDRVIRFEEIQKVELKQDSMGRYFDFGKLELALDNGRRKAIRPIAGAEKVRRWIEQLTNDAFLAKMAGAERVDASWDKQLLARTEEPAPLENSTQG
jgi:membrane protein YdbS with pleckstrin-like domain